MTDGSQGQLRRDAEAGPAGDRAVGEDGVVTRVRSTPSISSVHLVAINAVYNNTIQSHLFQLTTIQNNQIYFNFSYMSIIIILYIEHLK